MATPMTRKMKVQKKTLSPKRIISRTVKEMARKALKLIKAPILSSNRLDEKR